MDAVPVVVPKPDESAAEQSQSSSQTTTAMIPQTKNNDRPEMVILVYDVAKKKNIGTIIRSAVAFGVSKMLIVGNKKNLKTFGHQRTRDFMQFVYFDKFERAVEHLKKNKFTIYGCEICEDAKSVVSHPFEGNAAFIFGNEGSGLNQKALKACDRFLYIPQYGHGTASLNVAVAASIVLHHFSVWAKYPETSRSGFKFVVDETKKIAEPHINFIPTEKDLKRKARILAREERLKREAAEAKAGSAASAADAADADADSGASSAPKSTSATQEDGALALGTKRV
mmetsp:Transcript_34761/g.67618  ORF Transcript_34761/g.67618 Transcript_34761/m.67618 type:complete len:283 (-) Transcript_34761:64-912(-)